MNRIARMLSIGGLGLIAGVTFGAGPASAATSTDNGTATTVTSDASSHVSGRPIVGLFRSRGECYRAGQDGDGYGRWGDWDCVPTDSGDWALVLSDDDYDGGYWPGSNWPGGWPGYNHGWGGSWNGPWGGGHWHGGGGHWHGGGWHDGGGWHHWHHH